ncbi:hypothetical protein ACTTAI_16500 [Rhodobacter capsulatus]|uniref:hypothetical protein n=1 Tax=Rhodobacter capsulatus TaxID=1061 RepID=UPI004029D751
MNDMNTDTPLVTALGHCRDHLEAARMAEFVFAPKTDAAKALVAHLTAITLDHEAKAQPRKRTRQAEAQRSFTGAVSAFAADLIHHARFQEARGFFYRSSDKEALGQTLVSVRSFEQLLQFWPEMGLMEVTSFFRVRETWEGDDTGIGFGRARRFRATAELLSLAEGFGITPDTLKDHFLKETGRLSPVTVRSEVANRHGTGVTSANMRLVGAKYDAEVKRVREINTTLAQGGFDLAETPRVYRLFNRGNFHNFDFNMGGRLYCCSEDDWQQRSKEDRALITCRGEPTVELDVRGSHLFILYALHDLELDSDDDPYFLPGVERDVVKGLFVAMTGKGSRLTRFPMTLSEDYVKRTGRKIGAVYKLRKVLDALIAKHPVLSKLKKGSMDWARLQYEESECFMECLSRLGRHHGVAALPVFDSLIIAKQHQDVALTCLVEAYGNRFGCLPEVRCK